MSRNEAVGAGRCPTDGALPPLETVRPRATTAGGDPAVEIRFANGAAIEYRAADEGIEERWFAPGRDDAVRSHTVDVSDGRTDDVDDTGTPTAERLSDRALCTVASYLGFDDRRRAEFAWGDANVSVLTDEQPTSDGA